VSEYRFTKEHEWVMIKEGIAITGISDFAQEQLGDIVSIELPKVGSVFRQMQTMAIVDSVKTSSDIYAPISGEIADVNQELLEKPEIINHSAYDLGWIVMIKPSNMKEFDSLMTKDEYDKHVGEIK